MIARVLGVLLLGGGVALAISGVVGIVGYSQGEPVVISGVAMRLAAGVFLVAAGAFTLVFAFHGHVLRGVSTVFKRMRGTRIDEEISRLAKLRGDGYITGEEYEAAKKKLLDDL